NSDVATACIMMNDFLPSVLVLPCVVELPSCSRDSVSDSVVAVVRPSTSRCWPENRALSVGFPGIVYYSWLATQIDDGLPELLFFCITNRSHIFHATGVLFCRFTSL
ncbi:MAG: hypothetical protein KDA77_23160, partial [Planctomycetaceae bacterium]|nr:hypothetical protein [Planctomycetaceae bacterium]